MLLACTAAPLAARHRATGAEARDAAARLRATESRAADTLSRIDRLTARRQALQQALARDAAALARMLPVIERLSLYPAETLLASPETPADTLSALMILRGLAARLESQAKQVRARTRDLDGVAVSLREQDRGLAALKREQAARGALVEASAEQAEAAQRTAEDAAAAAARAAAADAARAATLQDAVARLEAAEQAAALRFQREAQAADRARRPGVARVARARAASLAVAAGPGLVALRTARPKGQNRQTLPGAPVAGRLVRGWGAPTDAGPATGVSYAPPALATVTAPCEGRVDFAGPFRSYGHMLILDCGHGYRFVLAGLDRLDVAVGQRLQAGAPVGRMPDWQAGGASGRPSLYVQLRRGSAAIDPTGFLGGRS